MMLALYRISALLHLKSLLRLPAYWVPTLLFPVMLYIMFGSGDRGIASDYRMASFVVYGVIGVAFFQFGISIAQERESHWERYRRTLPAAVGPRILAQLVSALVFALGAALLVIAAANLLSAPTAGPLRLLGLLVAAFLITIPFTLLGIALGYWTTSKSAVAVANLLYLPLAYLGGLWIPPQGLPQRIAEISPFTPTRQAGEIAWAVIGGSAVPVTSVLWLTGYSILFAALAWWGYRRDERRRYV